MGNPYEPFEHFTLKSGEPVCDACGSPDVVYTSWVPFGWMAPWHLCQKCLGRAAEKRAEARRQLAKDWEQET